MDQLTFKDNLLEWDELNLSSKKYQEGLKKIKDRIKELKTQNIEYMEKMDIDACNLEDGQITLRRTVRKVVDVKRSNLPEILLDYFQSKKGDSEHVATQNVADIMSFIEKNYSKSTESLSLTRSYNKH